MGLCTEGKELARNLIGESETAVKELERLIYFEGLWPHQPCDR